MDTQKLFGKRIKELRKNKNLAQEQLSEMIQVFQKQIGNIETGTTRVSLQTIVHLANALSVSADDLLCDNVVKAKVQFEKDIAGIIEDCDAYEIRVIADIAKSVKDTLRRDAYLRKNDT